MYEKEKSFWEELRYEHWKRCTCDPIKKSCNVWWDLARAIYRRKLNR